MPAWYFPLANVVDYYCFVNFQIFQDPFYAECHRPQHFLSFVQMEQGDANDEAEFEDFLE